MEWFNKQVNYVGNLGEAFKLMGNIRETFF